MFHEEQTHEEGDLEGQKYQQSKTGWSIFWELRMLCYVGLRCKDGFGYASLRATSISPLQPDGNNNSRVGALQEIKSAIQWVHYTPYQLCNLYISTPLAGIFGDFAET